MTKVKAELAIDVCVSRVSSRLMPSMIRLGFRHSSSTGQHWMNATKMSVLFVLMPTQVTQLSYSYHIVN